MPTLDEIKQFNEILVSLGSEPEILAQKSEKVEDIPPPEQELSDDLKELLDTPAQDEKTQETIKSETELDVESLFDEEEVSLESPDGLDSLDELPDEFPQDLQEEPPPESLETPEEEGTEEETQEITPEARPEAEIETETEEGAEGAESPDDFVIPDDFDLTLDEEEWSPQDTVGIETAEEEEKEEEEKEEGEGQEEAAAAESLEEDFVIPEIETGEPAVETTEEISEGAADETPGETGEIFEPPDEFIEGLDEEVAESPEEALEAAPEAEYETEAAEEAGELPEDQLEEPEGPPGEDFQLPEESDLILGEAADELDQEAPQPPEEPPEGLATETEEQAEIAPEGEPEDFSLPGEEVGEQEQEGEEPSQALDDLDIGPIEGEEEEFQIDEFTLPKMEDEIVADEAEQVAAEEIISITPPEEEPEAEVSAEEEREFTNDEFSAIQAALTTLPLNLKIRVQQLIGKAELAEDDQQKLIDFLIQGSSAAEIAGFISKATGQRIEIPRRFEKKTGIAFEEERKTFAYNFRENILPILRVFIPAAIAVFILGVSIFRFIIIPIHANTIYTQGYNLIPLDRYKEANEKFNLALNVNPVKSWFYRYADSFRERSRYDYAEEKYKQLLSMEPFWYDKRGTLDYAEMKSIEQGDYKKAEEILAGYLDHNISDYDALLAAGDNYMAWAEYEPAQYEKAYDSYLRILRGKEGQRDEIWFRMLRYYIRTDQLEEAEMVKGRFQANKNLKVNPEIYTELGGYLITNDRLDDVRDILTRSMKAKEDLPETYYHFSRYFQKINDPVKEEEALRYTLYYLEEYDPPTISDRIKQIKIKINTHNRMGEIQYERQEYIESEKSLNTAIEIIEGAQQRRLINQAPEYGKVYYNRGNIHYYIHKDLDTAKEMYEKALSNSYQNSELDYKLGYINYTQSDYRDALLRFYKIASRYGSNRNLLFSIANTLYQRNDYFAAQGYYNRLLGLLEDDRNLIPLVRPHEDAKHYNLVEMLVRTYNNLGVTLQKLSETPRNPEKETTALVQFTKSSEYFDVLNRDQEGLRRGETKNLAYLNMRGILYPQSDFIPQIYNRIPIDTKASIF